MLGILPAEPTDESAAFGPGDPQLLSCLHSHTRGLAIEELAPLPLGPASSLGSADRLPRYPTVRREFLGVETAKLLEAQRDGEGHRLVHRLGPSVLDGIFQLSPQEYGELDGGRGDFSRLAHEQSYRLGSILHLPRLLELVEPLDFLGRETHSEKVRGRLRRGR